MKKVPKVGGVKDQWRLELYTQCVMALHIISPGASPDRTLSRGQSALLIRSWPRDLLIFAEKNNDFSHLQWEAFLAHRLFQPTIEASWQLIWGHQASSIRLPAAALLPSISGVYHSSSPSQRMPNFEGKERTEIWPICYYSGLNVFSMRNFGWTKKNLLEQDLKPATLRDWRAGAIHQLS